MRLPRWAGRLANIGGRLAVAAILLGIILTRVDIRQVGTTLVRISPPLACAAAGVMLLVALVAALRWLVLLRALRVPVAVSTVIRLTYIAVTWNLALPGGESGNLVKAALLARQRKGMAGAVWASMLVDQITLVAAELLVALLMLALAQHPPPALMTWLGIIGAGMGAVLLVYGAFLLPIAPKRIDGFVARLSRLLAAPRWLRRFVMGAESVSEQQESELVDAEAPQHAPGEWLAPLWLGLTRYRGHIRGLLGAVVLAMIYYGTIYSAYWLAARGLSIPFAYPDIAWITALAGIIALLPITIAGAGVREGVIIYLLQQRDIPYSQATAFSLAVLALNIVLGIPGIFAQIIRGRYSNTSQPA
ncbi:MAG TPA: lysylphosphatidylglycerol synthase transmembrane domain-containing protein [Ktedonobacterales bacterium]|nr:lysylphosphatidylglycerol synthase transmembrane domain-containing protein [Ktedonobacterales bacterium]